MSIVEAYKLVKPSIVAFVLKYIPVFDKGAPPPHFPVILGTVFVVREDGVIATNAHVVRAFQNAFRPPDAPKGRVAGTCFDASVDQSGRSRDPTRSAGCWHD